MLAEMRASHFHPLRIFKFFLPSVENGARTLRFLMQLIPSMGRKIIAITVSTETLPMWASTI